MLYLIYIEPLLVILANKLKGLRFPNFTEVDDDYCDDVEIMIEDDQDLLNEEENFRKFESFFGGHFE
jgi:hypothetical protein